MGRSSKEEDWFTALSDTDYSSAEEPPSIANVTNGWFGGEVGLKDERKETPLHEQIDISELTSFITAEDGLDW